MNEESLVLPGNNALQGINEIADLFVLGIDFRNAQKELRLHQDSQGIWQAFTIGLTPIPNRGSEGTTRLFSSMDCHWSMRQYAIGGG
jgi:hypothetical protein